VQKRDVAQFFESLVPIEHASEVMRHNLPHSHFREGVCQEFLCRSVSEGCNALFSHE
jgi:hypothetical protein